MSRLPEDALRLIFSFVQTGNRCLVCQRWKRIIHLAHVCIEGRCPSQADLDCFVGSHVLAAHVSLPAHLHSITIKCLQAFQRGGSLQKLSISVKCIDEAFCQTLSQLIASTHLAELTLAIENLQVTDRKAFLRLRRCLNETIRSSFLKIEVWVLAVGQVMDGGGQSSAWLDGGVPEILQIESLHELTFDTFWLDFTSSKFQEWMAALAETPSLRKLRIRLSHAVMDASHIRSLGEGLSRCNSKFQELDLDASNLHGVSSLRLPFESPSMQSLSSLRLKLDHCYLSKGDLIRMGLPQIWQLKSLEEVDLSLEGNHLGTDGAIALLPEDDAKECSVARLKLWLRHDIIGPVGVHHLCRFVRSLRRLESLTLDVVGNMVEMEGFLSLDQMISDCCTRLFRLGLVVGPVRGVSPASWELLRQYPETVPNAVRKCKLSLTVHQSMFDTAFHI